MKIDIYDLFGVPPEGFQSKPFVTSWCMPTYLLAFIRLCLSIYSFTAIAFSFKWFADHTVIFHLQDIGSNEIVFPVGAEGIRQSFSYFTYETFWGLAFYFFFASMHGFVYARRGYTWLDRWPRYLQAMHSVFYSTIVCFPLLVTTIYWGSMWTRAWWSDDFSQWNMITMHAMNSVFAGFEIIVTQTKPLPVVHLTVMLLIMSAYLGVAYITKATEGIYIYLWLDPNNGLAQLFIHVIGYAALCVGFYLLARFSIQLRCRWVDKVQQKSQPTLPSPVLSKRTSKSRPYSFSNTATLTGTGSLSASKLHLDSSSETPPLPSPVSGRRRLSKPRPLSAGPMSSSETLSSSSPAASRRRLSKSRPSSSSTTRSFTTPSISSKRVSERRSRSSLRPQSSSRDSIFWSYDRYELEMLKEEREKHIRTSSYEITQPEAAQTRPQTGRSSYSQATTMAEASPRLPESTEYEREDMKPYFDYGWPLVTQPPLPMPHGRPIISRRTSSLV